MEDSQKEKREKRNRLLDSIGVKQFFEDGRIKINMKTCRGVECELCIKACPTSALYWKAGEIGIEEELCVHCTACVVNCIVDDCIKIKRKRATGEDEEFSKPIEVLELLRNINSKKRRERIESRFREEILKDTER